MVCVRVIPPPEAVTVRIALVAVVPVAADNFRVLLPVPGAAMSVGVKLAVIPFGTPLTDSAMADLNPFTLAVDTMT